MSAAEVGDPFDVLMNPESVAVIGASPRLNTIRGRSLWYAKQHGFGGPGRLFAVNPSHTEILGVPCVPRVTDIGAPVDVGLIAVPATMVPDVVADCATVGIRAVVILSAGFADAGAEGTALQERTRRIASEGGVRVLGPNCIGVVNLERDKVLSFASAVASWTGPLEGGRVAILSQSGAVGNLMLALARKQGLGIGHVITTGNEMDLSWSDGAQWLSKQAGIDAVLGYIESVGDPEAFCAALGSLRASGKAVTLMAVGRTAGGGRAAASHTGRLAGDFRTLEAVCQRYGVRLVSSLRDLTVAGVASLAPRGAAKQPRVGLITASGGLAAALADECADRGIEVPQFSAKLQSSLASVIPAFGSAANPVDVTGQVVNDATSRLGVLKMITESEEVDAVGLFVSATATAEASALDSLIQTIKSAPIPVFTCWISDEVGLVRRMNQAGCPAFDDPSDVVSAFDVIKQPMGPDGPSGQVAIMLPERHGSVVVDTDPLTFLAQAGLPVVSRRVFKADELLSSMSTWNTQVYVKAILPDVSHKSDVGAVLGPVSPSDVGPVTELLRRYPRQLFEVQEALTADWELILGVRLDRSFGYVGVVGAGGIWTEVLNDVYVLPPPMDKDSLEPVLRPGLTHAAFGGLRGRPAVDARRVLDLLAQLMDVASKCQASVLECNPVLVLPSGELRIVDCVLEFDDGSNREPGGVTREEVPHNAGRADQ